MARIGYKYYIIVNSTTGRIDNNCVQCHLVRSSTSQPTPTTDGSHSVEDISKIDYGLMKEWDHGLGKFKRKWNKGQGRPIEDI